VNASETSLEKGYEIEQGPFGFSNAVVLDKTKKQCLDDSDFAATEPNSSVLTTVTSQLQRTFAYSILKIAKMDSAYLCFTN